MRGGVKRWVLLAFFLVMLLCTVISRIYDSVTIPKVRTTVAKRKTVETVIEGTGTVKVKEKTYHTIIPGLRIGKIQASLGNEVEAGEVLFWYDMEALAETKEKLTWELEQLALSVEKEKISQEPVSQMTQAELALWELNLAQRELEEGRMELEASMAEHDQEKKRLEEKYIDSMDLTEEELWMQQERDWESARNHLDTTKNSRDREMRAAQRVIEDLEEDISSMTEEDESARRKLEKQLERAREDLEDLENSWEDQVDAARSQLEFASDQEDRIQAGLTTAQEAREEAYEVAVKQLEEQLDTEIKQVGDLERAVEKAQWQLAVAQKQDAAAQMAQEQQNRISNLTVRGMELDQKEKERKLHQVEELMETGGQVLAWQSGVVTDLEIITGKTATGEELVSLAVGDSQFEGTFLKEEQELAKGDTVKLSIPGTNRYKEAVISRINLLGDTKGIFQADLDGLELELGTITSYTCTKQSDLFPNVIPLAGLRKDMKGYYCLVAKTRSTILGEEFRAERVDVELICQGSTEAAVEGALFEGDWVIVGESQAVGEGSRVRPVSGF